MPYLRDTAYVLKSEPYREHDAWITLYGRNHGKMEAVARGVRTWKAKQRGHLEPLTKTDVMIAVGTSFDKLAVAHAVNAQTDLRKGLDAMAMLGSFSHLVDHLTRPGVADPEVFHLLDELATTWRGAVREATSDRARFLYAVSSFRLMSCLGYAPSFERIDLSDDARRLMQVLPEMPLAFALAVTAPTVALNEVAAVVEKALERTPLAEHQHGSRTISAILSDF